MLFWAVVSNGLHSELKSPLFVNVEIYPFLCGVAFLHIFSEKSHVRDRSKKILPGDLHLSNIVEQERKMELSVLSNIMMEFGQIYKMEVDGKQIPFEGSPGNYKIDGVKHTRLVISRFGNSTYAKHTHVIENVRFFNDREKRKYIEVAREALFFAGYNFKGDHDVHYYSEILIEP